jgi:hypothetical protein
MPYNAEAVWALAPGVYRRKSKFHRAIRADIEAINRPASVTAPAIGKSHPCDRQHIRFGYFPGRIRRLPRTQEEYGRRPTDSCDSSTSIPNRRASISDWSREPASSGEMPLLNQYGRERTGRDHAQKSAREDNPGPSAASTHARTIRCRTCVAVLALPVRTNGTTRVRLYLSEVRRRLHARPA